MQGQKKTGTLEALSHDVAARVCYMRNAAWGQCASKSCKHPEAALVVKNECHMQHQVMTVQHSSDHVSKLRICNVHALPGRIWRCSRLWRRLPRHALPCTSAAL